MNISSFDFRSICKLCVLQFLGLRFKHFASAKDFFRKLI